MWMTNFKVRALAEACFGKDLPIFGFDQKGLHFNESGSKNIGSLCLRGAPDVPLKENHAATRERFSLMTTVCSTPAAASCHGGPALEVLFKGKTAQILRGLRIPADTNMSSMKESSTVQTAHPR